MEREARSVGKKLAQPPMVVARTSYLGGPAAREAVPQDVTASAKVTHTAPSTAVRGPADHPHAEAGQKGPVPAADF